MRVGKKRKKVYNPKRWTKPVEIPRREPERKREREKVPVRREEENAD